MLFRLQACNLAALFSLFSGVAQPSDYSVTHAPLQPRSHEPVTVTARSPEATLGNVVLQLQVVEPGAYTRKTDDGFQDSWRDFPMDRREDIAIVSVPPEIQKHRGLVRYRLKFTSESVTYFPAPTNACPNFAWFVYDRLPDWTGASKPGQTEPLTFSSDFLSTLPVYHLLARTEDVQRSQWDPSFYRQPFFGTLIHEGRVYDHIQFHNRGQASTYVAGKNKWGIKFNSGQEFNATDFFGAPYREKWKGLNLNPCASAWAQVNRGMAGMDEALSYRAYQLAGVPSPDTFWMHFRVIDSANESSTRNQYDGDLWGLYLVVQEKNGAWLREKGLPDGNIYSAAGDAKHKARNMPSDSSDLDAFAAGCRRERSEEWWNSHLDLPAYYSFHSLNRLLANIDLRPTDNFYVYHRPDNRWVVLPHDLDMMFIPKTHQPGYAPQIRCLDPAPLRLAFQNRAREILDLFGSDPAPSGGQIGQLVDELSRKLRPAGHPVNWAQLDEAMWNYHPRNHGRGQFNLTPYHDRRMGGNWERTLSTPDFAGFCKYLVDFCTDTRPRKNYRPNDGDQRGYGFGHLWSESRDDKIPATPEVRFTGGHDFSVNHLTFRVSAYASPTAAEFAAVQWRVAEVSAPGLAGFKPGVPFRYEIEPSWSSGEWTNPSEEIHLPSDLFQPGRTYRARARHKDETGRWSHWSPAVQFATAE